MHITAQPSPDILRFYPTPIDLDVPKIVRDNAYIPFPSFLIRLADFPTSSPRSFYYLAVSPASSASPFPFLPSRTSRSCPLLSYTFYSPGDLGLCLRLLVICGGYRPPQMYYSKPMMGWVRGLCSAFPPFPDPVRGFSIPLSRPISISTILYLRCRVFQMKLPTGCERYTLSAVVAAVRRTKTVSLDALFLSPPPDAGTLRDGILSCDSPL